MFCRNTTIVYDRMTEEKWTFCTRTDYQFLWLKWNWFTAGVYLYDESQGYKITAYSIGRGYSFKSSQIAIANANNNTRPHKGSK